MTLNFLSTLAENPDFSQTGANFVNFHESGKELIAMEFQGCLRKESFRDALRAISRIHRRGRNPLMRDLVDELGSSHSTITFQVERLVEEGYVRLEGARSQTKILHLTELGERAAYFLGARVLGEITAGPLRAVSECWDGVDAEGAPMFRQTWDEVLPCNESFGTLQIKGDSMIGECINDGDEVQLELGVKLHELEPGEIGAVMVGDEREATLKYVFVDWDAKTVTLKAANPNYRDITAPLSDVRLVGVFYGLVRVSSRGQKRREARAKSRA